MSRKSPRIKPSSPPLQKAVSQRFTVWTAVRVAIGLVFVVSGFEKLIGPYQNFQFVIEQYQIANSQQAALIAQVLPWIELIAGAFFALGLHTRVSGAAVIAMSGVFFGVVGQALVRRLPMDECGCFGDLVSIPLPAVLAMDAALASLTFAGLKKRPGARAFSIDAAYERG